MTSKDEFKVPLLRATTYGYNTNAAGDESGLNCKDKSLAQQHLKDECDINVLVDRFIITGEIPQMNMPPMQGDFTNAPTMQEALILLRKADEAFMQQPAEVRARFDNDPAKFVDFCSNEANRDELRRMGMTSPEYNARADEAIASAAAEEQRRREEKAAYDEIRQFLKKADTQKGVS